MTYDPDEGIKHNKKIQKKEKARLEEFRELLSSQSGRKYVFEILIEGFIFTTTFTKSSESFFNEGKRSSALKHFNDILDLDPQIFAQMCAEFRNKRGKKP